MKFKTFGKINTMAMLNYLLRRLALLVGVLAASHAWAQSVPSWNAIGPTGGSLITLMADPSAPTTALYVGTEMNGVFRSTDAGATWSAANSGMAAGRHVYALAALGNFVYAATDGGVYVAAAGASLVWTLLPSPRAANPAPACDITLLASAKSTLYMAATCESNIYATSVAGVSPVWQTTSVPVDSSAIVQNVTALGLLDGNIALGSVSAVYLLDTNQNWINSEAGATNDAGFPRPSGFLNEHVAALVSSSPKWAFACTAGGLVFQADLSVGVPLTWVPLVFSTDPPTSCRGLAVARVNAQSQSVLAMATDTGAFVSTAFDDTSAMAPGLVPGPAFPMSSHLHAAWQLNPSGLSSLLWATEFGLYASSTADLSSSTTLTTSATTALNGPTRLATPSQRLDNVSVRDMAVLGTSLYAIAESTSGTYLDVMASADGGANWTRTGLSTQFPLRIIRSLVADVGHSVLYAGTDQGVYYLQGSNWLPLGNVYDVRAMAVGAQALYTGRNADASPSGGLVIQSLVGGSSFTAIETPPVANFSVRSLVVAGGSVYAAGGVKSDTVDGSVYDNAVYFATDLVPATPAVAPTWALFGSPPFPITNLILSHVAVGAGQVFAGGDGFLFQCLSKSGSWGAVAGLPTMSTGEPESVSALVSDGTALYVGTSTHGLLAMTLNVLTPSLSSFSGTAANALPSATVNEMRVVGTNLYVATNAGLATATTTVAGAGTGAVGASGGGGCSMAIAGEPDPLLWLLVTIATLQIIVARRRRVALRATAVRVRRHKVEDRQ